MKKNLFALFFVWLIFVSFLLWWMDQRSMAVSTDLSSAKTTADESILTMGKGN